MYVCVCVNVNLDGEFCDYIRICLGGCFGGGKNVASFKWAVQK